MAEANQLPDGNRGRRPTRRSRTTGEGSAPRASRGRKSSKAGEAEQVKAAAAPAPAPKRRGRPPKALADKAPRRRQPAPVREPSGPVDAATAPAEASAASAGALAGGGASGGSAAAAVAEASRAAVEAASRSVEPPSPSATGSTRASEVGGSRNQRQATMAPGPVAPEAAAEAAGDGTARFMHGARRLHEEMAAVVRAQLEDASATGRQLMACRSVPAILSVQLEAAARTVARMSAHGLAISSIAQEMLRRPGSARRSGR